MGAVAPGVAELGRVGPGCGASLANRGARTLGRGAGPIQGPAEPVQRRRPGASRIALTAVGVRAVCGVRWGFRLALAPTRAQARELLRLHVALEAWTGRLRERISGTDGRDRYRGARHPQG